MICPECGEENQDSAKFCKHCGTSLNTVSTANNSQNQSRPIKSDIFDQSDSSNHSPSSFESTKAGGDNRNLIIICLTIIICAVLIAGGFIFLSNNGSSDNVADNTITLPDDSQNQSVDNSSVDTQTQTDAAKDTEKSGTSGMQILSGSFSTGSSSSDKTHCSVYVGQQYAGQSVKISVLYSYGGANLNKGNIVPKTVSSDGYISVPTADVLDYYPDYAFITIYDSNGNVLDTQGVNMNPRSGTQSF